MPRLKLLLNVGTADAKRLDLKKTLAGDVVDVKSDAAAEMVRRGWATDKLDEDAPAPEASPHNSAGLPSDGGEPAKPADKPAPKDAASFGTPPKAK